jgi:hypothetical protein
VSEALSQAKIANHRFVCVPGGDEVTVKNLTWEAASAAIGALGWRVANFEKRGWALCCPKHRPAEEADP